MPRFAIQGTESTTARIQLAHPNRTVRATVATTYNGNEGRNPDRMWAAKDYFPEEEDAPVVDVPVRP